MKLYAAPLQGFTEAPWRNLHQEVFGGIDAYYTPFVRMEKGEFRNKDVREIASGNNTVSRLIPQLIASTPAELERLAGLFIEKGYKEADINMGCPFPLMTGKHKGSGILPYPAEVEALLKELVHYPELGFSVKMRLGWECADEWRPLLPLLNAAPLRRIVLHPRIGKQQYKGEVDLAAFTAFYEECTFRTHTHCIGNSHLDGTTVGYFAFNLTGNVVSHDNSIQLWSLNFEDINLNILISNLLQLLFQLVNFLATFADNDTRTCSTNGNSHEFQCTFNYNS